jgi:hypothetical protein
MPNLTKAQRERLHDIINTAFDELVEEGIVPENKKTTIVGLILPTILAIIRMTKSNKEDKGNT